MRRIVYNNLEMNTGVPDENGALWYCTGLEGWSGPSQRQSVGTPISRHGVFLSESMLDSRAVVMKGVCKAATEAVHDLSFDRLMRETNNLQEKRRLEVYETVPKYVMAVRADAPEVPMDGPGSSFAFEVSLFCEDPLKYSLDQMSVTVGPGATVTITNNGTFPVSPLAVTRGTVSLSNLTTGGTVLTKPGRTVPDSTILDFDARTAMVGNISYYDSIATSSTWWYLAEGDNRIRNQGSASATFAFRHAYL